MLRKRALKMLFKREREFLLFFVELKVGKQGKLNMYVMIISTDLA